MDDFSAKFGTTADQDRRRFLLSAGKFAAVVPPTMTLLLSTSMSSAAIAQSGGTNPAGPGGPSNPTNPTNPTNPGGGGGSGPSSFTDGPATSRPVAFNSPGAPPSGVPGVDLPAGSEGVLGAPPAPVQTFDPASTGVAGAPPSPPVGAGPTGSSGVLGKPAKLTDAILNAGERG